MLGIYAVQLTLDHSSSDDCYCPLHTYIYIVSPSLRLHSSSTVIDRTCHSLQSHSTMPLRLIAELQQHGMKAARKSQPRPDLT